LSYEAKIARQAKAAAEVKVVQAEKTVEVVTKYVDRVREVKVQGETITKEVPVYVPVQADAQCIINHGFVRLHDSAASGVNPGAPGNADAAPSGIALSTVAETVTINYNIARQNAEQLKALQEWVKAIHGTQVPVN
jgi:hypothetical protein